MYLFIHILPANLHLSQAFRDKLEMHAKYQVTYDTRIEYDYLFMKTTSILTCKRKRTRKIHLRESVWGCVCVCMGMGRGEYVNEIM